MSRPRLTSAQFGLVLVLLIEIAVFSLTGRNFATRDNAFEVARLSVEIGLLALAMTPVILTGGIDLSVGSLMGLSAVLFGKLWRDAGWPIGPAIAATLLAGAAAGAGNGLLVTRLRMPPLIVTLGSYSLFRGLAEGITGGVDNFTGFPAGFLFLGQGYLGGILPPQLPILLAAALGFWLLVHRTTVGRALVAIGFSPEGARHAGIAVERHVRLVYLLSGGGDHRGGAGRNLDLRRPRHHPRHAAGPGRHRRAAERATAGRPARRTGWGPDGAAIADRHCTGSAARPSRPGPASDF